MNVVTPHMTTHVPHHHIEDEFLFVLDKNALFILNGNSVTDKPYPSFYCPSGVEHVIRNIGDTELKYLVIKKYIKK
jgi:mannose-6-phosphate isomerase-like protein (cupin superfamily)